MTIQLEQCVGVTGSQYGMTMRQFRVVYLLLKELRKKSYTKLRHGDCIQSDENMALMGWAMGYEIIGHPPDNVSKRAHFPSDWEEKPAPYLVRNHRLVRQCQYLIATPRATSMRAQGRAGGTVATVRYAVTFPRAGHVVWPNGTLLPISLIDFTKPVQQGAR
jgi:hypothetical protein